MSVADHGIDVPDIGIGESYAGARAEQITDHGLEIRAISLRFTAERSPDLVVRYPGCPICGLGGFVPFGTLRVARA